MNSSIDLPSFLAHHEALTLPVKIARDEARWSLALTGDPTLLPGCSDLTRQYAELHSDSEELRRLAVWAKDDSQPPLTRRAAQVLHLSFLENQGDKALRDSLIDLELELEQAFSTFRAPFEGNEVADNVLEAVLAEETDSSRRREAWEATRAVGTHLSGSVREVVRLRNRLARDLGYADYRQFSLTLQEFDPSVLDGLLDRFEEATAPAAGAVQEELNTSLSRRFNLASDAIQPWHYPNRFHQSLPQSSQDEGLDDQFSVERILELVGSTFARFGVGEAGLWPLCDLHPRPGKSQHAFCMGVDPPRDVRVLCNLAPTVRWATTALHEFGHAAYDLHIAPSLPSPLRFPAHTFVTEAVAMWFGRLTSDPTWLSRFAGIPAERTRAASLHQRREQIVFARFGLVVCLFERELYRDPEQDLAAVWWGLSERLQGVRRPAGWQGEDWAAKIHVALAPAYYQNYLLGEMLASQFDAALAQRTGLTGHGAAFLKSRPTVDLFVDLFRRGASQPWGETVTAVTGEPLNPAHFARQFLGAAA